MRDLTAGLEAAILSPPLTPLWFFEGLFDSGPLRLWNGFRNVIWDSKTWTRSGGLIRLTRFTETSEARKTRLKFQLAGLDQSILPILTGERYADRDLNIWLGAMNVTGAVIDSPYQTFAGKFDQIDGHDSRGKIDLVGMAYSLFEDQNQAPGVLWDDATQQEEFPGDTAFSRIPALQDMVLEIEKRD